jgi:hypothetical protein
MFFLDPTIKPKKGAVSKSKRIAISLGHIGWKTVSEIKTKISLRLSK